MSREIPARRRQDVCCSKHATWNARGRPDLGNKGQVNKQKLQVVFLTEVCVFSRYDCIDRKNYWFTSADTVPALFLEVNCGWDTLDLDISQYRCSSMVNNVYLIFTGAYSMLHIIGSTCLPTTSSNPKDNGYVDEKYYYQIKYAWTLVNSQS